LSSQQTPILIARHRYGRHLDAVLPDRSEHSVSAVLKQALFEDRHSVVHGRRSGTDRFCAKEAIECELIIASHGEHVHEKVLHVQTVNSYVSRLKNGLPA
jgi:hypothetical protein